jgi:hypothetical protein
VRKPGYVLFDYLEEGSSVEEFLNHHDIDPDLVHGFVRPLRSTFVSEREMRP